MEKQESEVEAAEGQDVVMQSYPSPSAEGQDSGPFYNTNPRSDEQHELGQLEQPAEDQNQLDGPPTPRQQIRHAITSAEELQLAAQLSQGIAHGIPMMDPSEDPSLQQMVDHHELDQHEQGLQQHEDALNGEVLDQEPLRQDSIHQEHLHTEHIPGEHLSQDHLDQEHMAQEHLPQEHMAQDHLPQDHLSQDHLPQDHMPQEHIPQDHLAQEHITQDHMHQEHIHQDHMHPEHMQQEHMQQDHLQHEHLQQDHLQQEHMHQQHDQLANHDQALAHGLQQDHQSDADQILHQHGQQGHQQQSQPQYMPSQPQSHQHPPHLQPSASMEHLPPHFHLPDNTPPRKRSKVSRACDECRRKKVKCDSTSESGEEPCSNCRRSNIRCMFSRIPQKRGPSKGYIKELADRINHIEGKLNSEGNHGDATLSELLVSARRESSDIFQGAAAQSDDAARKRPYSSISGAEFGTPTSSRQPTWSTEPRPIQPYGTPTERARPNYSANGLAPTPIASKTEGDGQPQSASVLDGMIDLNGIASSREVDESTYNGYLEVIHPSFPLLATSKDRLEAQLTQCPSTLRDAFIEALHGAMQTFPSFTGPYASGDMVNATRMITEWEVDVSKRPYVTNLVHLQTLILIAIATDNYGPGSLKGEHGGAAKASILGRAVGLAYSMRLHVAQVDQAQDLDLDSDENVAVRAWWTLVSLDRWNAISTASPLLIPNDSVVILPGLSSLLGENGYHLVRLSNILGHFAPVALAPPKAMTHESGAAPLLSSFFNLSMELFREVLPAAITPALYPILHMVYWHCRLLAYLFQTNAKSSDILWPCKESVALLTANAQLITPLNYHFFSLTTLTLLELKKVEAVREEAIEYLKELHNCNLAPSTWDETIRARIAEHIETTPPQSTSMEATASQSLQHLADLATATELDAIKTDKDAPEPPLSLRTSDNYDDVGFDPRSITRGGYLNVLAAEPPRASR
ncbi:transcriptional regulatory protein [Apiospora arundinis]|uniref:Transcriptional regulatory protein n=1 Tax=Apiospora arundinis TaxID=335852 RepID=A0ABR2I0D9_9PEZI